MKLHYRLSCLALVAGLAAFAAPAVAAAYGDAAPTVPATVATTATATAATAKRPRVGLVLSGGGARGIAHLGVLRVLEELHVPVDCVAGTSMGGVVGGVFASGMPLDEMVREVRAIDWSATFQDRPDRRAMNARRKSEESGYLARPEFGVRDGELRVPDGVLYGQRLEMLFTRLAARALRVDDFSRLPLPFKAVATDIEAGAPVVIGKGGLVQAMRATMSVPGVMAPIEIDGRALVDGGLVDNLPVDVARAMCADVVIAVNLGTPLLKRAEIRSVFGVGVQMVNILTEQNVRASLASLGGNDVLISPELGAIGAGDFDRTDDLMAAGEAAARRVAPALRALAVAPEAYAAWRAARQREGVEGGRLDEIRIVTSSRINSEVLAADFHLKPGYWQTDRFLGEVNNLYERGDFERVGVRVLRDGERNIALIEPQEKSWGPNFLRFGMSLSLQAGGDTSFNVVANHTRSWLNAWGGEWRSQLQVGQQSALGSEFFQPLGARSPFFVAPRILINHEQFRAYAGDSAVALVSRRRLRAGLDLGFELERAAEFRLGVVAGEDRFDPVIALPQATGATRRIRAWTARADYDRLDSINFPSTGQRLTLDVFAPSETLGADATYMRSRVDWLGARTWGRNTISTQLMYGHASDALPYEEAFTLGGFQSLSGYGQWRFRARDALFGRLGYQRVIKPPLGLELGGIISRMYAGGSLEGARMKGTFDPLTPDGRYYSASLYIGADTLIGPVFFGVGQGAGGNHALWLSIGIPWMPR